MGGISIGRVQMSDIITRYEPLPIPDRQFDWKAYHKVDHDKSDKTTCWYMGWGSTEAEALADLKCKDEVRANTLVGLI